MHRKTERKQTPAAIWQSLFLPKNESSEWQGHTKLWQKEPILSGEAVRDTESWAQGWEGPFQIHAFYLPLHQGSYQLLHEPFQ